MKIRQAMVASALALAGLGGAVQAQGQVYLGGGFGQSRFDSSIADGLITSGSVERSDSGFKIFGGFQLNPNLAVEAAYVDLGQARYSGFFFSDPVVGGRVEASGINLSAVGILPLTPAVGVFAKAGLFLWNAEASDITAGVPFRETATGTDLSLGIGMSVALAPNLSLRAEWEQFKPVDAAVDLLSISVVYRF